MVHKGQIADYKYPAILKFRGALLKLARDKVSRKNFKEEEKSSPGPNITICCVENEGKRTPIHMDANPFAP